VEWLRVCVKHRKYHGLDQHPSGARAAPVVSFLYHPDRVVPVTSRRHMAGGPHTSHRRPLARNPGERLVSKIADATRAHRDGTVATAIVKGAVIGIAYFLTGVPHPLAVS